MESTLKIGDKVRVGDKIGEVIRLDQRESSTIIKVAFEEGPAKDFVCPPTKIDKILSPIEQIQQRILVPGKGNSVLLFVGVIHKKVGQHKITQSA